MKLRKFYPFQVVRRLDGCRASTLVTPHCKALSQWMRRGRKYGFEFAVIGDVIHIGRQSILVAQGVAR